MTTSSVGGTKTKYKIVFLGDQNTGKTSIIYRFINNTFYEKANVEHILRQPTIGIDFLGKSVAYKGKNYRLQLWDTAGQYRFRSLIPSYLKDAICVIYVFDLSSTRDIKYDNESLRNLENWTQLFKENRGQQTVAALCGNKLDLYRNFDLVRLRDFQSRNNLQFFQVSAATGYGIDSMFFAIIEMIGELIVKMSTVSLFEEKCESLPTEPHLNDNPRKLEDIPEEDLPRKRCCL